MNQPTIKKIAQILALNLHIPIYQRPYKWQTRHVQQLLQDLQRHWANKITYRLGTVVLHQEPNSPHFDIVDGQQRLITLVLIAKALGVGNDFSLLQQKLLHSESHHHILENFHFIQQYIEQNIVENRAEFTHYIFQTAELVCVTLSKLDEAFQFFDSQNAHGKPLESYDLLKAYHLRAMQAQMLPENRVFACVEQWEYAALLPESEVNLHKIINKILFPLRQWAEGESGEAFTSQHLAVFKGVSSQTQFPYMLATQFAYPHIQAAFQIHQTLLDGEYFFDFIQYYRQNYQKLFEPNQGKLSQLNYLSDINTFLQHHHSTRTGDQLLRRLFECTVLAYYDKFGDMRLDTLVRKAFIWVYQLRLIMQRIEFATIDNYARNKNSLLLWIERSHTPEQVLAFMNAILLPNDVRFKNVHDSLWTILQVSKS